MRAKQLWIIPFLMIIFNATIVNAGTSLTTKIFIDPMNNTAPPGATFTVDVNITDVEDLYAWGLKLGWDPDLLDVTNVEEGPFLKGQPIGSGFTKVINNVEGYVDMGCTTIGEYAGVSGSGILVTITFLVEDVGECVLDMYGSSLLNYSLDEILHTAEDGYFFNLAPPLSDLVRRSAWPEHHHFDVSKDEDAIQTLYGKVKNKGLIEAYAKVVFDVVREDGETHIVETSIELLLPDEILDVSGDFGPLTASDAAKYYVSAQCWYSFVLPQGYIWFQGEKIKTFSFAVVP